MTTQCCKCKKVQLAGEWTLQRPVRADQVSHTYCPDCLGEAMEEFRTEASLLRTSQVLSA